MRDSPQKWYTTQVTSDLIEQRCNEFVQNYIGPNAKKVRLDGFSGCVEDTEAKIFMSIELYAEFTKLMSCNSRGNYSNGVQLVSWHSGCGTVVVVSSL